MPQPSEMLFYPSEVAKTKEVSSNSLRSLAIPAMIALKSLNFSPETIAKRGADSPPINETTGAVFLALGLAIPIIAFGAEYIRGRKKQ